MQANGLDIGGRIYVNSEADGNFIGIVFGYQNSSYFYIVQWTKTKQTLSIAKPFMAETHIKAVRSNTGPGEHMRHALRNTGSVAGQVQQNILTI